MICKTLKTRDLRLQTNAIASLEELKQKESGVAERYVKDYVLKKAVGELKQDFRTYIGGRASRKLGKSGETDSIALYNKASGRSVAKNNKTFTVTQGEDAGTVIPDFYKAGEHENQRRADGQYID